LLGGDAHGWLYFVSRRAAAAFEAARRGFRGMIPDFAVALFIVAGLADLVDLVGLAAFTDFLEVVVLVDLATFFTISREGNDFTN
jgi:hypothetical protein